MNSSVEFSVCKSGQKIVLTSAALKTFSQFRQVTKQSTEAGGLLFARFDFPYIRVMKATAPTYLDKRTRFGIDFSSDKRRTAVQLEFRRGLHFIGEWHTHPELDPTPSQLDVASIRDLYIQSTHELNYFLMVIVGNGDTNLRLWLSIHNSETMYQLQQY